MFLLSLPAALLSPGDYHPICGPAAAWPSPGPAAALLFEAVGGRPGRTRAGLVARVVFGPDFADPYEPWAGLTVLVDDTQELLAQLGVLHGKPEIGF